MCLSSTSLYCDSNSLTVQPFGPDRSMDPWINAARPNRSFQGQTPPDSSFGGGGGGAQRDLPQPGDDVRVRGVKGQAVHLHGQMGSFAASDPKTLQRGEEGLLLVEEEEKTAWERRSLRKQEVHTHIYSTKIKLLTRFIKASSPLEKGLKLELSFTLMSTEENCLRHQIRAKRIKTHTDCNHYWGRHPPVEKHCFVWS